jgi:DNA-binding transcriptional LysR family regulator
MSKFEQIEAFIAVVETHGFLGAAKKIGVSSAAISRQVSRLEAELKVELLRRTTRCVALTEVGSLYFQQCKKTLEELNQAEKDLAGSHSEAIGTLHVTSNRYFASQYILPYLPEFMALHPKLQIKLELAERFPNLAEEGIDLVFGVSLEGSPELVRKRFTTTRYVLSAAPIYLEKYGVPKQPTDLNKHHYITHSMRKPADSLIFKNNQQIYVEPILWLNDSQAMRECAIRGMGIVKLHDYMVLDALQAGRLIEILQEFQDPEQSVYLYYQPSRYLQPKIRHFIDFYTHPKM